MIKIFYTTLLLTLTSYGAFEASISQITPQIKERMLKGNSWKQGCPVTLDDLRYLRMKHIGFNAEERMGEMIVHKAVSDEVVKIFETLYDAGYPIHKMKLVSDYKGSDWQSIEADNTSAFNCRKATGS